MRIKRPNLCKKGVNTTAEQALCGALHRARILLDTRLRGTVAYCLRALALTRFTVATVGLKGSKL